MRKLFLSIIALTLSIGAWAQNNQCIEIGIGTYESNKAPIITITNIPLTRPSI